jgi:hypothetical protein
MKSSIGLASVVLVLLLSVQPKAVAGTLNLPPANGFIDLYVCAANDQCVGGSTPTVFNLPPSPQSETFSPNNSAFGSASISYPSPSIFADLRGTNGPSFNGQPVPSGVSAYLRYYFEISDPLTLQKPPVSVTFSASGGVGANVGGQTESAIVAVQTASEANSGFFVPNLFSAGACSQTAVLCSNVQNSFAVDNDFSISNGTELFANTEYAVTMQVSLTSNDFTLVSGFVDPTFTIDSGQSSDFQLVFSPTTTPLPPSWIMMLTVLSGFSLLGWRRRRRAQAVA